MACDVYVRDVRRLLGGGLHLSPHWPRHRRAAKQEKSRRWRAASPPRHRGGYLEPPAAGDCDYGARITCEA